MVRADLIKQCKKLCWFSAFWVDERDSLMNQEQDHPETQSCEESWRGPSMWCEVQCTYDLTSSFPQKYLWIGSHVRRWSVDTALRNWSSSVIVIRTVHQQSWWGQGKDCPEEESRLVDSLSQNRRRMFTYRIVGIRRKLYHTFLRTWYSVQTIIFSTNDNIPSTVIAIRDRIVPVNVLLWG